MYNLDLDFKERRCKVLVSFLLSFIVLLLIFSGYLYRTTNKKIVLLKKETHILFESDILPKGLVRKKDTTVALISINGEQYFVKEKDTLSLDGINLYITITDSTLTVRTTEFKRSLRW